MSAPIHEKRDLLRETETELWESRRARRIQRHAMRVRQYVKFPSWRRQLVHFVDSKAMDYSVYILLLFNCALLSIQNIRSLQGFQSTLDALDNAFTCCYVVELLLKVVAHGVSTKHGYLSRYWNWIDGAITVASFGAVIAQWAYTNANVNVVAAARALRLIRPLRMLTVLRSLRALLRALGSSLSRLGNVAILTAVFLSFMSLVALAFFQNSFQNFCQTVVLTPNETNASMPFIASFNEDGNAPACVASGNISWIEGALLALGVPSSNASSLYVDQTSASLIDQQMVASGSVLPLASLNDEGAVYHGYVCAYGSYCVAGVGPDNGYSNFNTIFHTAVLLYTILSLEGWSSIMFYVVDGLGVWVTLYFVANVIVGTIVVLNLVLATITDGFSRSMGLERRLNKELRSDRESTRASRGAGGLWSGFIIPVALALASLPEETLGDRFRKVQGWVRTNILFHPVYQVLRQLLATFSVGVLATTYDGMSDDHRRIVNITTWTLTCIFAAENLMELIALGLRALYDPIRFCDWLVSIGGLIEVGFQSSPTVAALRAIRWIEIGMRFPSLRHQIRLIIHALHDSIPLSMFAVTLWFVAALIGMQLFAGQFCGQDTTSFSRVDTSLCADVPRLNFDNIGYSLVSVFVIFCGDGWRSMLVLGMQTTGDYSALYFCFCYLVGGYLMMNLVVAVMIASSETLPPEVHQGLMANAPHADGESLTQLSPSTPVISITGVVDALRHLEPVSVSDDVIPLMDSSRASSPTATDALNASSEGGNPSPHATPLSSRYNSRLSLVASRLPRRRSSRNGRHATSGAPNTVVSDPIPLQLLYTPKTSILKTAEGRAVDEPLGETRQRRKSVTFVGADDPGAHPPPDSGVHFELATFDPTPDSTLSRNSTQLRRIESNTTAATADDDDPLQLSRNLLDFAQMIRQNELTSADVVLDADDDAEADFVMLPDTVTEHYASMDEMRFAMQAQYRREVAALPWFRRIAGSIVKSPRFLVVYNVIVFYLMCTIMTGRTTGYPDSSWNSYRRYSDLVVALLFLLEALLKILHHRLLHMKGSLLKGYLNFRWNIFDGILVIVNVVGASLAFTRYREAANYLLVFRAFRPFSTIGRNERLKVVAKAAVASIPSIRNTGLITVIVWLCYAIFGTQMFAGRFAACTSQSWGDMTYQLGNITSQEACLAANFTWTSPKRNFDTLGASMLTLFQIATVDNWTDMMFLGVDSSASFGVAPQQRRRMYMHAYFFSFILLTTFFLIQYFVASMCDVYFEVKLQMEEVHRYRLLRSHEVFLDEEQKSYFGMYRRALYYIKPPLYIVGVTDTSDAGGAGSVRSGWWQLWSLPTDHQFRSMEHTVSCLSRTVIGFRASWFRFRTVLRRAVRHRWHEPFVIVASVVHVILEALTFAENPPFTFHQLLWIDVGFTVLFSVFMVATWVVHGTRNFLESSRGQLSLLINALTIAGLIVEGTASQSAAGAASLLRQMRVFRLLRVTYLTHTMRLLIATLIHSLSSFLSVFYLLFLMFFIYAAVGMQLFGRVMYSTDSRSAIGPYANFDRFDKALIALLRIATFDDWSELMYSCAVESPSCDKNIGQCPPPPIVSYVYFLSFAIVGQWIGINFFSAEIIDAFSHAEMEERYAVQKTHVVRFQRLWKAIVGSGEGPMSLSQLAVFLSYLGPPLGPDLSFRSSKPVREERQSAHAAFSLSASLEGIATMALPDNANEESSPAADFITHQAELRLQSLRNEKEELLQWALFPLLFHTHTHSNSWHGVIAPMVPPSLASAALTATTMIQSATNHMTTALEALHLQRPSSSSVASQSSRRRKQWSSGSSPPPLVVSKFHRFNTVHEFMFHRLAEMPVVYNHVLQEHVFDALMRTFYEVNLPRQFKISLHQIRNSRFQTKQFLRSLERSLPDSELLTLRGMLLDGDASALSFFDEQPDDDIFSAPNRGRTEDQGDSHPFWQAYYRTANGGHNADSTTSAGFRMVTVMRHAIASVRIQAWWRGERARELIRMAERKVQHTREEQRQTAPRHTTEAARNPRASGQKQRGRLKSVVDQGFEARRLVRQPIADKLKAFHDDLL